MKHVKITYDWATGHIKEEDQQTIEVTTDITDLIDQGKAVMITKSDGHIVVYTDDVYWRFKQR